MRRLLLFMDSPLARKPEFMVYFLTGSLSSDAPQKDNLSLNTIASRVKKHCFLGLTN